MALSYIVEFQKRIFIVIRYKRNALLYLLGALLKINLIPLSRLSWGFWLDFLECFWKYLLSIQVKLSGLLHSFYKTISVRILAWKFSNKKVPRFMPRALNLTTFFTILNLPFDHIRWSVIVYVAYQWVGCWVSEFSSKAVCTFPTKNGREKI